MVAVLPPHARARLENVLHRGHLLDPGLHLPTSLVDTRPLVHPHMPTKRRTSLLLLSKPWSAPAGPIATLHEQAKHGASEGGEVIIVADGVGHVSMRVYSRWQLRFRMGHC